MAGVLNFLGALSGTAVGDHCRTRGSSAPSAVTQALVISALLSAGSPGIW